MKLKIKIHNDDFVCEINVGNGLNDFTWLALTAAKLYGKFKYPAGNYLPTLLKVGDKIPHPKYFSNFFWLLMKSCLSMQNFLQ